MIYTVHVTTRRQGLHEVTHDIQRLVVESGMHEGLCTIFIRHTSASLLIQENADVTAKRDLEAWLNRLVAENDSIYTHTMEGRDDMPAHIKSALTQTHLSIPILNNALTLGTWQGIYVWEHRHAGGTRELIVHIA